MKPLFSSRPFTPIPPALACVGLLLGSLMLVPPVFGQSRTKPYATVDLSHFAETEGFSARTDGKMLTLTWRMSPTESGILQFNLAPDIPLFNRVGLSVGGATRDIMEWVDPLLYLSVGTRNLTSPAGWVAFFDNPIKRDHRTSSLEIDKRHFKVTASATRMKVEVSEISAPPFKGRLEFTLFRDSPLIFAEAVMSTQEEGCAIVYDAGIGVSAASRDDQYDRRPNFNLAWLDETDGQIRRVPANPNHVIAPVAVSRRTIVAETPAGSVALFPSPHQYFPPADFGSNLGFVWHGQAGFMGYGLGIRQPREGDRRLAPWNNAPPGTQQRLGVFYLIGSGDAAAALEQAGRYTRHDRYKPLPGHATFSSHYHIEHTFRLAARRKELGDPMAMPEELRNPGFVRALKEHGVDIVHLGEFHRYSVPGMSAKERLPLLKLMFEECARLSDEKLLILPGEEANVHLGGHWMCLFPKPVYWVLNRPAEMPFIGDHPEYGRVYHVGDAQDVLTLMEQERGLMWTAHPRIKGSRGFPDHYRDTPFYRSDRFLGGAWKSMPVDLSLPRLGSRVLDLQDEMANRGERKYIIGEADLFDIEPGMEIYAHLNINYLRLERVPKFAEGWQPVLEALRGGKFFVSTGEILLPQFKINDKESGEVAPLTADGQARLQMRIEWTFPLIFAEIVSGDGEQIYRQRIDLSDTPGFGSRDFNIPVALKGRKWARLEVWDVARNGAFTPPIWLESRP